MNSKPNLASRLRHRVSIESPLLTMDSAGGFNTSWTKFAEVWAEILPKSGQEIVEGEQLIMQRKLIITIRYLEDITAKMRLDYHGRKFAILSILNPYEENILLEIIAQEQ